MVGGAESDRSGRGPGGEAPWITRGPPKVGGAASIWKYIFKNFEMKIILYLILYLSEPRKINFTK